jgi:SAM-dependent methyltransferase
MKIKKYFKPLTRTARKLYYFGQGRYCPICQCNSRRFGATDLPCLYCGSLPRHRLVWLFLKRKTGLFNSQSKRMLHVAPEKCFEKKFSRLLGDGYITGDLTNPSVKVKMDLTDIPFDNQSFDMIYCSHVLEHISDDQQAIRELYRVLEMDGWAILMVPIKGEKTFEDPAVTDPKEREIIFGQCDHVRKYGSDFIDRIREAGFHVAQILPGDFLTNDEITRYGTRNHATIFYCTKK